MAGMEFEYDEEGSTFYFFVLSFWALIIIPTTYYLWPRKNEDDNQRLKNQCHCLRCDEKRLKAKSKTSWLQTRRRLVQFAIIIGWVIFFLLAYKVSTIQIDFTEYDPFQVLQIDRGASDREIKKAYRKLSLQYHPDKATGDSKMFMKVAKAYAALTDEQSKKNWLEYGNPDGPGATIYGIAIPKWIVASENSIWVLFVYIVVFMVIMPAVVGMWWYKSIKFSKDLVLLDTTKLYMYFFSKNLNMILKKLIMVAGASFEFDKFHNPEIVERPSDNEEVPMLMKMLPNLDEKNKERPLCFSYSVKARALYHAHFARLELPPNSLDIDRQYVLKKTPALVTEMINVLSSLVASAMARQRPQEMPRLETVENCMKFSQMVMQALDAKSNPLLQLPHITPDMLRHFVTKKRNIQRIRDLIAMDDDERRALLRNLNDAEYQDVMNVCAMMPNVQMTVRSEVLDDEDSSVTANSIVTVTVQLKRKGLMDGFDLSKFTGEADTPGNEDEGEEAGEEETDQGAVAKNTEAAETKHKAWQKPSKGKKKPNKAKAKKPKQPYQWKKTVQNVGAKTEEEEAEKPEPEGVEGESEDESENETVEEEITVATEKKVSKRTRRVTEDDDDHDDWERFQEESKKENSLDMKKKESHSVHCPHFPEEKQEGWWLYMADKKNHMLVTAPVQILSLKTEEEVALKFSAPPRVGIYTYCVQLRSDSYFDFDQSINLKLDVKEAKIIEDHPQWDISDDEEDQDLCKDEASDDSDYSTDADDSDY